MMPLGLNILFPTDLYWERDICKSVDAFFQAGQILRNILFHYEPFDLITFRKSRGAAQLNHNIPIQVSEGLNWKLAA